MDAFAAAHRREASLCAIADVFAPKVCAGLLLDAELRAAKTACKIRAARLSLSLVADKLGALNNLCRFAICCCPAAVWQIILAAGGANIGNSLADKKMLTAAKLLLQNFGDKIVVMDDVIADDGNGNIEETALTNLGTRAISDIGINTRRKYADIIQNAGTVIWSGPMGKYENPQTNIGTNAVACAVAQTDAYTLAGGGDTISAINIAKVADKINHISTGGGAFLQMLAGGEMPALDAFAKAAAV